jgi:hypothetical protein
MSYIPGCIPCKVYAEDTPILTIDSIVICQTHAEDLRRRLLKMHPGIYSQNLRAKFLFTIKLDRISFETMRRQKLQKS